MLDDALRVCQQLLTAEQDPESKVPVKKRSQAQETEGIPALRSRLYQPAQRSLPEYRQELAWMQVGFGGYNCTSNLRGQLWMPR